MAEIVEESQTQQIPYITEDIASTASQAKQAADEFFEATEKYASVEYVKTLRDAVTQALAEVYPANVGAPTGPYIDGLLKQRKQLEELDTSIRAGKIPVKPEDEEAATLAINMYQRFAMGFMFTLGQFEEGLSADQRW